MTGPAPVRVLLADDDALVCAGLTMMLAAYDDIEVVGAVGDGAEVVAAVERHRPRVVLMDIRMPRLDGLAATELLRARPDPPAVVVLTTFDTDRHIRRAMRVGASGFLLKHTPPDRIADAVRRVAAGEPMLSPDVTRRVMALAAEPDPDPRGDRARLLLGRLTPAEGAVAARIGLGRTNGEIGRELHLSTATVKAYVSRILTKLELTNRVQVALLVREAE